MMAEYIYQTLAISLIKLGLEDLCLEVVDLFLQLLNHVVVILLHVDVLLGHFIQLFSFGLEFLIGFGCLFS